MSVKPCFGLQLSKVWLKNVNITGTSRKVCQTLNFVCYGIKFNVFISTNISNRENNSVYQ